VDHADKFWVGTSKEKFTHQKLRYTLYNDIETLPNKLQSAF